MEIAKADRTTTPTRVLAVQRRLGLALDAKSNHLMAALPEAEWQRWLPRLEAIELPLGLVLYECRHRRWSELPGRMG